MTDDQFDNYADLTAEQIAALTDAAFQELIRRVLAGEDPATVVADIQSKWAEGYKEQLSAAFSAVLNQQIGAASVAEIKIGKVQLSARLYAHSRSVSSAVRSIIHDHVKGFAEARKLALRIYEGYRFKPAGDPLRVKTDLPKYLRKIPGTDPVLVQLRAAFARMQASDLKTPALKASYLQLIDEIEFGAGQDRLRKMLQVAWYERNRYFGNRIAQTELARAHNEQRTREIIDDDGIRAVQWRMSGTHPRTDICDLLSRVNRYGLGPGIYPKDRAPVPPAHPFCRCKLSPRLDVSDRGAKDNPAAAGALVRQIAAESPRQAAQIVGSRNKLMAVLKGADPVKTWEQTIDPLYRLKTSGDL